MTDKEFNRLHINDQILHVIDNDEGFKKFCNKLNIDKEYFTIDFLQGHRTVREAKKKQVTDYATVVKIEYYFTMQGNSCVAHTQIDRDIFLKDVK